MQEHCRALDILPSRVHAKRGPSSPRSRETAERCSTDLKVPPPPQKEKVDLIASLFSFKTMIPVAFDRRLWVCVAKSAFSLMVIYAQITLESIISLWWAVTAHNSWGDVDRDSVAVLGKHNTLFQLQLLLRTCCF